MLLHVAHQARSRESLQRLLDAALDLLDEFSWEKISITTIARRVGMSVGGFYARFKSKDALLLVLHERYEEKSERALREIFRVRCPTAIPSRAVVGTCRKW